MVHHVEPCGNHYLNVTYKRETTRTHMHSRLYRCFFISHKAPYTKDRMGSKFGIGSLSIVMTLLLSLVPKLEAEFTTVEQAIKSDGSISFLVIGDWGRRGLYNQSQVALQVSLFFYRIYTYIYNIQYTHLCCIL